MFFFIYNTLLAAMVLYFPGMRDIDYKILHGIQGGLSAFPYSFFDFVSYFGSANYWLWPRITVTAVLISHKYYMKAFLFLIITKLTMYINDLFLKGIICRQRPCGEAYGGYSFPSGHVALNTCLFGILIYLVYKYVRTDWWRTLLITIFSIWIILVALSRMFLNVHFLTDVTAGFFVGIIMINLYIILDKFFNN